MTTTQKRLEDEAHARTRKELIAKRLGENRDPIYLLIALRQSYRVNFQNGLSDESFIAWVETTVREGLSMPVHP